MTVTPRATGDVLTAAIFNTKIEAPLLLTEIPDGLLTAAKLAAGAVGPAQLAIIEAARVRNTAAQSIPNNTYTALTFDTEITDASGMHDGVNPDRLTAITAGVYLAGATVQYASNATGLRQTILRANGSDYFAAQDEVPNTSFGHTVSVVGLVVLAAGGYVQALAYQNSGGALNTGVAASYAPTFWLARLGRVA